MANNKIIQNSNIKMQSENSKLKIIFISSAEFGAIILEKLIENNFKPLLVITAPDKPVGREQIITPPSVKIIAKKYKIPFEQPEKIENYKLKIENLKPDLIIVAAYSQIIPKEILDIPKYGCLNLHPSLLPKHRGPTPIQSAILNGDKETGVTIILMDEKIDHGPILVNSKFKIPALPAGRQNSKLTYQELHDKLADLGAKLLIETIPKWLKGEIKAVPQNESEATYTKIFSREDGRIDWKKPIDYIERQIRALNPEPGTYTLYKGKILKIFEAEIQNNKLIIKKVQLAGKKPMSFEDFLRGHQDYVELF